MSQIHPSKSQNFSSIANSKEGSSSKSRRMMRAALFFAVALTVPISQHHSLQEFSKFTHNYHAAEEINRFVTKHSFIIFIANVTTSLFHFTIEKVVSSVSSIFGYPERILHSESAWHNNLRVMQRAELQMNDDNVAHKIRFLAVNYLNKVAPSVATSARMIGWKLFETAFQISPFTPYQYHRAFYRERPHFSSSINQRFAMGDKSPLLLTDTDEVNQLFPLKFVVLDRHNKTGWERLISEAQEKEILFDFTDDLKDCILTEGLQEKERTFNEKIALIEQEIATLSNIETHKCTAIARVKFECQGEVIGGMKILPIFSPLSPDTIIKTHPTLAHHFTEETGIALGAIQLRRLIPEAFPLPKSTLHVETETAPPLFADKNHFIERLKEIRLKNHQPHVAVLGKSFLEMIKGLFDKIPTEEWHELYQCPPFQEIIENSLTNILHHLAAYKDEAQFIQAIELAYAELATLLELTSPYQANDFQELYPTALKIVPESLQRSVRGGLGKTAETVFSLAIISAREMNSCKEISTVWSEDFYFEHANLLGRNRSFELVMSDPSIKSIDFFGCSFHPSIDAKAKSRYNQRNLIHDIERIFTEKKETTHLTVALDCTNDLFNSPKTQELLAHFESHIREGRLNIILFGSGQKFDMLGMDHFYGSPFSLINNGADHWKSFDTLLSAEVNRTDLLSNQWFCLLYEYAPDSPDGFRKLFFDNTREVLRKVPEKLAPLDGRTITVIPIDESAQASFIDVKIRGSFHFLRSCYLIAYFYSHAVAENNKASIRGSFGFLHPNITMICSDDLTTLRLHPGILRKDNQAILSFLHSLN
jgi:hypothetical protein